MRVSEAPNGTLMRALALTAQPLASSSGPMLRVRSLSQAISIDGPEINSNRPTSPSGIHRPSPKNDCMMAPSAAVMPPTATPKAATTPTSNFFGATAVASPVFNTAPALSTAPVSMESDAASEAAARLATWSSMKRTSFL